MDPSLAVCHQTPANLRYPISYHAAPHPQQSNVPAPTQPGILGSPPFNTYNKFMAGYLDCAQEAIRYLTEVEGLPSSHPMVVDLQCYLHEQRRLAHIRYLLRTTLQLGEKGVSSTDGTASKQHYNVSQNDVTDEKQNNISENSSHAQTYITQDATKNKKGTGGQEPDIQNITREETEKLAIELAEEIFSLLQESDDEMTDEEVLEDEGFGELIEP